MGTHCFFLLSHWVVGFDILPRIMRKRYIEVAQLLALLSSDHQCGDAPALWVVWPLFFLGSPVKMGFCGLCCTMLSSSGETRVISTSYFERVWVLLQWMFHCFSASAVDSNYCRWKFNLGQEHLQHATHSLWAAPKRPWQLVGRH